MPSLREIRGKIKSVKSTQKITRAMKMVSAARLRRAQTAIVSSRPFAVRMEEMIQDLAVLEVQADVAAGREVQIHPLFDKKTTDSVGLVLVTADKGLCGPFNTNILRNALEWLRKNQDKRVLAVAAGRKAKEFLSRLKGLRLEVLAELVGVFPRVGFAHAELLGKTVLEAFIQRNLSEIFVIYNEFKSIAQQRVAQKMLLPLMPPENREVCLDFSFEPSRDKLLDALLPRYIKAQLYRILLESQAAELAARMNAMEAASKNAGELISGLTLRLNRTRQSIITKEIAELVGGAEALAA
ncbi:MAG: ATP synthase F1 subunit gamma [Elusimicrobia bacterium]|nr:ATP synthase F1 subunit gamma [Elusimicrobiota bacterium]